MWALMLAVWGVAALSWSMGGCSQSGDTSVDSTRVFDAGGSAGASGAAGGGGAVAGAGGTNSAGAAGEAHGGGGDGGSGGGGGSGSGSGGWDGGIAIVDAAMMPDAVETDGWCAPTVGDPKLEQATCCNDLPCNGLCYASDGGALSCECFGLVGGCPAGKVCCSAKLGCTDPLYCGGK